MNTSTNNHVGKPVCLPDPFEWMFIPSGQVTLHFPPYNLVDSLTFDLQPFYIAKYLITNAQYAVYEAETGYRRQRLQSFDMSPFSHPLQPAYDVLWHEAMLFCNWLSEKVGYRITLPTDAQWQRAAQGDDNRLFPWGDVWDKSRCNTAASGHGRTTLVTHYPQGASPFGVLDMIGNLNEWCLTDAQTGEKPPDIIVPEPSDPDTPQRIFRGGDYTSKPPNGPQTVHEIGAISIGYTYLCGIRVVTSGTGVG